MKRAVLLGILIFAASCAPPARAISKLENQNCGIEIGGICGGVRWKNPVTATSPGELEIQWQSVPPPHVLHVKVTMDCCGGPAPCEILVSQVDALCERISGIRATGGDWTILIQAVGPEGQLLGKTQTKFSI